MTEEITNPDKRLREWRKKISDREDIRLMKLLKNIEAFFPENSEQTEQHVLYCYEKKGPTFISLKADKNIGKKW